MLGLEEDCAAWDTEDFMKVIISTTRLEAALVARLVRSVWKEIDERLMLPYCLVWLDCGFLLLYSFRIGV